MTVSFAELSMILGQLWWPFFRVGAVFISMPFFGDALIPVWVRSLLALSIVVITAPLMPPMPEVELFSMTSLFLAFEQAIWGRDVWVDSAYAIQCLYHAWSSHLSADGFRYGDDE